MWKNKVYNTINYPPPPPRIARLCIIVVVVYELLDPYSFHICAALCRLTTQSFQRSKILNMAK